jgi:RNA recognition motif-containing protein
MKIFVGNLPYQADEHQLQEWFSVNGFLALSVNIVVDRISGQPRGFGFVEVNEDVAVRCILACNGQDFLGRTLVINNAETLAESRITSRTRLAGIYC